MDRKHATPTVSRTIRFSGHFLGPVAFTTVDNPLAVELSGTTIFYDDLGLSQQKFKLRTFRRRGERLNRHRQCCVSQILKRYSLKMLRNYF